MRPREIKKVVSSRPATDGAGVKINRLTGFARDFLMDPFLMLDEIPVLSHGDAEIRLIAGSVTIDGEASRGAVDGKATRPLIADVTLSSGGTLSIAYPSSYVTQIYVYEGVVSVAGTEVRAGNLAYLDKGDLVVPKAGEDSGLLLFGGQPINEPVAHYGPFVMTTQEEIDQAMQAYRDGTLVQA
jgi:quercetin 2,3-dioxygenase